MDGNSIVTDITNSGGFSLSGSNNWTPTAGSTLTVVTNNIGGTLRFVEISRMQK
jgi:hypothetical protein